MAVVALVAIFGFGRPASAQSCPRGFGSTVNLQYCDDRSTFAGLNSGQPCTDGHFEIWNHDNPAEYKNSTQQRWCYTVSPWHTTASEPWFAPAVCVEFWYLSGSTWKRWGTIACMNNP
jgi:hypothetical protein